MCEGMLKSMRDVWGRCCMVREMPEGMFGRERDVLRDVRGDAGKENGRGGDVWGDARESLGDAGRDVEYVCGGMGLVYVPYSGAPLKATCSRGCSCQ